MRHSIATSNRQLIICSCSRCIGIFPGGNASAKLGCRQKASVSNDHGNVLISGKIVRVFFQYDAGVINNSK